MGFQVSCSVTADEGGVQSARCVENQHYGLSTANRSSRRALQSNAHKHVGKEGRSQWI